MQQSERNKCGGSLKANTEISCKARPKSPRLTGQAVSLPF